MADGALHASARAAASFAGDGAPTAFSRLHGCALLLASAAVAWLALRCLGVPLLVDGRDGWLDRHRLAVLLPLSIFPTGLAAALLRWFCWKLYKHG